MSAQEMTELDQTKLRGLHTAARKLNEEMQLAVSQGYELRVRVEENKEGVPRVRFTLHRQVGS